jgi:ribosomal protein L37E
MPTADNLQAFTCPRCGMTSHHPGDIREGYCGNCHDWTREHFYFLPDNDDDD